MFYSLLRFEFSYQLKQKAFIGFSLLFLAFGILQGSQGYAPALVDFNSPYQVSFNVGIATLGCVFVIMFFAISGILRDKKHQMESIIYSTPLQKGDYFWSRFLGIFTISLLAFSMVLLGFLIGTHFPGLDSGRMAPFNFKVYAGVWSMIVLPNLFICSTIIFFVALLSKNNIATYISAILIYSLYMIGSLYFNSPILAQSTPPSPENMVYAALADPFGLAAFFEQTQYWTPFEKNHNVLSFSGLFLWNRVVWVIISSIVLGLGYHFISFKKINQSVKKIKEQIEVENTKSVYQPVQNIVFNLKAQWQSFKTLLKIELVSIFKSLPFIAIMLLWIVIVTINIYEKINSGGTYNDSLYPSTNILIGLTRDPIFSLLLIIFYSGELVHRVRDLKFDGIIDSTPTSSGTFYLSKLVTLILLPIILISTSTILSIIFQISKGYYHFEFWQYITAFYYSGMEFFFYILLALFVQSLVYNKYLGMVITGLLIAFLASQLSGYIGIEHPMLKLGRLPHIDYTNMSGYGNALKPFNYYVVYWNSLGLILTLFSFKLWQRGTIHQLTFRLKRFLIGWKKWERLSLVSLGVIFLISGYFIFYNVNIIDKYETANERLNFKADYEKKYKKYESLEKLTFTDIKTQMDIFPMKGKYKFSATCILENVSDVSINHVLITERESLDTLFLENADLLEYDSKFETYLFELKNPLLPNRQLKFSFSLLKENIGFRSNKSVVKNGSYIFQHDIEPTLGYRRSLEIKNDFERKKRGLQKRTEAEVTDNHIQAHQHHNAVPIHFETIISTHKDQIAIAPGDLMDEWKSDDRHYFHYKSSQRILGLISYFSASYKVLKETYKGVAIELYYHQGHEYNIKNTLESTKSTLDYCIPNFGQYPFRHLRIAEIPAHFPFGGQAMPGNISMVEDRFYLIDNTNPQGFDLVAKRTIHEVAHQWWGMVLNPKIIEGGSILIEGLAKYTEAVVMEKKYGKRAIWQISESANNRYFSGRAYAQEKEPPLYFSDGEGYLSYGKNFTAMLALKELIGESNINKVLRILVERHRDEIKPSATSIEFIEELYKVSALEDHRLIDDWLKRVITYDLKIIKTNIQKQNDGRYKIVLTVSAKRFEKQLDGDVRSIPIDEPIPIGAFSKHPKQVDSDLSILYFQSTRVNKEESDIEIILDELPRYISIDPFGTRSDKNRQDNIKELEM